MPLRFLLQSELTDPDPLQSIIELLHMEKDTSSSAFSASMWHSIERREEIDFFCKVSDAAHGPSWFVGMGQGAHRDNKHCLCSYSQVSLSLHLTMGGTPVRHRKTAPFGALVLEPFFSSDVAD